jgi:hypothetical protein
MEPRTRDFLAAGLLAIVLVALVVVLVVGNIPKAA